MTNRPVVIAGGGTAGHILPGLSVARALVDAGLDPNRLRWIGSQRGQEAALVEPSGIALTLLGGRGVQRSMSPRAVIDNLGAIAGLAGAVLRAIWIMGRTRPAVVLSLGGYASAAAAFAAVLWRIPVVIAEQNAVAGAANRVVGRFAAAAAVPFPGTGLPNEHVTGNPVRDIILAERPSAPEGIAQRRRGAKVELGVDPEAVLVAVFAGSLGSRRINEAIAGVVDRWVAALDPADSERPEVFVHHVVGRRDFASFRRPEVPTDASVQYRAVEYEDRMDLLLSAADVALCRSGGTTVAELAVLGVPSLLVPLPIAPGDHQRANAAALVDAAAAVLIDDAACTADHVEPILDALVVDSARREAMATAAWGVGRPDAAAATAELVLAQLAPGERFRAR